MSDKQVSTKNTSEAAAKPAMPADRVLAALTQATAAITGIDVDTAAKGVQADCDKLIDALTPTPPRPIPADKNPSSDPAIAPYWHQEKLDLDKAAIRYANAKSAAAAALEGELNNWSQAQSQYAFAMGTAHVAMTAAVKAATDAYTLKNNPDSHSRSLYLFYTMKEAIAAAIQDYQKGAASAAAVLASEAGALLGAHAAFLGSVGAAQGNLLADQTTAAQTFWQGVEQVRDAV